MSKFKRSTKVGMQAISTASLPDIVFMLLFFFMVTTVMRETEMLVKYSVPKATEVRKLENKSLVSYIYVGFPYNARMFGEKPRIQLNDKIEEVENIQEFVYNQRADKPEVDQQKIQFSIKADGKAKMDIITKIKLELRKASALRINYSSKKETKVE